MNYLKMVAFKSTSKSEGSALFTFKNSEEVNALDKDCIVPNFMILEAIFQAAGKVAREYSDNKRGAYIVSFSGMKFNRVVLSYEQLIIESKLMSMNKMNGCIYLSISAFVDKEVILKNVRLILKQSDDISTGYLNNSSLSDHDKLLKDMGFSRVLNETEADTDGVRV